MKLQYGSGDLCLTKKYVFYNSSTAVEGGHELILSGPLFGFWSFSLNATMFNKKSIYFTIHENTVEEGHAQRLVCMISGRFSLLYLC